MKMVSFNPIHPNVLHDVWREERARRTVSQKAPGYIFVLQDWDVYYDGINLDEQIKLIKDAAENAPSMKDKTLKNLFNNINKTAFLEGTIAIINAVAGVRSKGSKRTGYLTDPIHKGAYPNWATALKDYATGAPPALKHVFFCGEWAKWNDTEWARTIALHEYLSKWNRWTKCNIDCPHSFGSVTCSVIPHPAIWHLHAASKFLLSGASKNH